MIIRTVGKYRITYQLDDEDDLISVLDSIFEGNIEPDDIEGLVSDQHVIVNRNGEQTTWMYRWDRKEQDFRWSMKI